MEKLKGLELLRKPFDDNQISQMCRSTKKDNPKGSCPKCKGWHGLPAIQLDYVGHAALTDRLLDADDTWTWKPLALNAMGYPAIDNDGGLWIELTVCGVTRLGYGDAQGKQGGDAMKERIGDALRNAAMRFGAALDLWHKGDLHVEEKEEKEDIPTEFKKVVDHAEKVFNDQKPLNEGDVDEVITAKQAGRFYGIGKATGATDDELKAWLKAKYGWTSTKQITKSKYEEVCEAVKSLGREAGSDDN